MKGLRQICLPEASGWHDSSTCPRLLLTTFVVELISYPRRLTIREYSLGWRGAKMSSPITSVLVNAGSPLTKTSMVGNQGTSSDPRSFADARLSGSNTVTSSILYFQNI